VSPQLVVFFDHLPYLAIGILLAIATLVYREPTKEP
jgi:hypothetical protein